MKIVGDELSTLALSRRRDSDDFDLLGRSAYNRYYYSAYLTTRHTIGLMQSEWRKITHSGLPTLLEVSLMNVVKIHLEKQRRSGLITQSNYSRLLKEFRSVSTELANLLRYAYHIRGLADYEPEIKLLCDKSLISLQACKITTAREWAIHTERLCGRLLKLWREIGLG